MSIWPKLKYRQGKTKTEQIFYGFMMHSNKVTEIQAINCLYFI